MTDMLDDESRIVSGTCDQTRGTVTLPRSANIVETGNRRNPVGVYWDSPSINCTLDFNPGELIGIACRPNYGSDVLARSVGETCPAVMDRSQSRLQDYPQPPMRAAVQKSATVTAR